MANPITYGNAGILYGTTGIPYGSTASAVYQLGDRWSVDGTPLQTYAYNIATWGGSRQSPPPLRGSNVLIPHRAGQRWLPKTADSKTITLGMWVIGALTNGTVSDRTQFEKNWRALRKLLWQPDREFALTKIFLDDNGVIKTATAKAQFAGGLEPEMNGRTRAAFTVDLLLADPFFYSSRTTHVMTLPGSPTAQVPAQGDVPTDTVKATFTGPLTTPRLSNNSLPTGDIWVQYNGTLSGGETVVIDSRNFTAVKNGTIKQVGLVSHYGDYSWMKVAPTSNNLSLTAVAGTGTCSVEIIPAWI